MCHCIDGIGIIFRFISYLANFEKFQPSLRYIFIVIFTAQKYCFKCNMLFPEHMELTKQLQSLPIRCDTLRVQNRRSELENKLAEIDDAIRIFSRPKVFVKLSS